MSETSKEEIRSKINVFIKTNGNEEITASQVNEILQDILDSYPNKINDVALFGVSEYQSDRVYRAGIGCFHDGVLYESLVDTTPGGFDSLQWKAVGGGFSGTVSAGYIPITIDGHTFGNSRSYQTTTGSVTRSANNATYLQIDSTGGSLRYSVGDISSSVSASSTNVSVIFSDGTNNGTIDIDKDQIRILHNKELSIGTPQIRLSNLTADSVLYLDPSKILRSSLTSPTALGFISDLNAPVQLQLNAIISRILNLSWKEEVKAATTTNIPLYGTNIIDGVDLVVGDRCLVKNQTIASDNGIRIVSEDYWERAPDADTSVKLVKANVKVRLGSQKDSEWSCSNTNEPILGTDAITFTQFNSGLTYLPGVGLVLSGNTFSIANGGVTAAMLADAFLKANGETPLTNTWDTGRGVVIGDPSQAIEISATNGIKIFSIGKALQLFGGAQICDGTQQTGYSLKCRDVFGNTIWKADPIYTLPKFECAATSLANTDTNVLVGSIPPNTLVSDGDKVEAELVFSLPAGTTGELKFGFILNATDVRDIDTGFSESYHTITFRIKLERRSGNRLYHTIEVYVYRSATLVFSSCDSYADTTTDYTFINAIPLIGYANQKATGRPIGGHYGKAVYYKAI